MNNVTRQSNSAAAIMALLFAALTCRNFWIGDDAFIPLRSLDQLFAGNGPHWILVDSVQAYTSPLWFWLMAVTRIVIRDVYPNAIFLSLLFMAITALLSCDRYKTTLLQPFCKSA